MKIKNSSIINNNELTFLPTVFGYEPIAYLNTLGYEYTKEYRYQSKQAGYNPTFSATMLEKKIAK